jgi:Cyclic nucleotide-binding domain
MRVESRVLSVSWVPSNVLTRAAVARATRLPFVRALPGADEPPPDELVDPAPLLAAEQIRQANELRAWVEFDQSGSPVAWDYGEASTLNDSEGGFPVRRSEPEVRERAVRFVQTAGARLGGTVPRRVGRRPFIRLEAPVAWTTIGLTIESDGRPRGELVGASPFPRHWLYDESGKLQAKSAEIDFRRWLEGEDTRETPWGPEKSREFVALAESALERGISQRVMGARLRVRSVKAGTMLTGQGDRDDTIFLILDGIFDVDVGGQTVAEVGPGAVVGERGSLEGRRSATLRARSDGRVVALAPASLTREERDQLAAAHRREDE